MTSLRVWGVLCLLGAVALAIVGLVEPELLTLMAISVVALGLTGAFLLWLALALRDVPRVSARTGLERMATGTALAARTLQDLTGQTPGATRGGIDPFPGVATVVAVTDTGVQVHGDPVVLLDLAVVRPDRAAYSVRIRQIVGAAHVGRLRVDEELPVLVDAQDPYHVTIRWDASARAGG